MSNPQQMYRKVLLNHVRANSPSAARYLDRFMATYSKYHASLNSKSKKLPPAIELWHELEQMAEQVQALIAGGIVEIVEGAQ